MDTLTSVTTMLAAQSRIPVQDMSVNMVKMQLQMQQDIASMVEASAATAVAAATDGKGQMVDTSA